jgi:ankyrin repeat protein
VAAAFFVVSPAWSEKEEATMLIDAAQDNDIAGVRRLIGEGAPLDARDAARRTALLIATRENHVEIAAALVEAGADVNAKDNIRDTPFLYAGAGGRNAILKIILASGRANLSDTNRYGGTALIPAAHHGHPETVRILLDTAIDKDHVNHLGWTALMEAVILGDGSPTYREIVGDLVRAGARDIPDNDGVTALQHARRRGFAEIERLIEAGGR